MMQEFDRDQPRVPAGSPEGGQSAPAGGSAAGGEGKGKAYLETTIWNLETPKVEMEWQADGTARIVAHNEEKHAYVELNLGKASAKKLASALATPPAATGQEKDFVYLETTIPDLVVHKVEFDWQPDGFGRLIVHNEEKHTYIEIALKPQTVEAMMAAMRDRRR